MRDVVIYAAPGTCARVPCIALEEIGVPFEYHPVVFMRGEHKSPEYKKLNPKGKIPCLVIDGEALTENVAILSYLNQCFADAHLLPATNSDLARAHQLADLSFCASTLHPLVTRIRLPHLFASADAALSVFSAGCEAMHEYFRLIEDRLTSRSWWYGETWSIVDAYLYWIFWRVEGTRFSTEHYPRFCEHAQRMVQRPSVQRALSREEQVQAELDAEGLAFRPPPLPDR